MFFMKNRVSVGTRFFRHAGSNHSFKTFAAAIRACNNNKRGKCGGIYVQESSCQLLNATAFFPCYDNRTVTCVSLLTLCVRARVCVFWLAAAAAAPCSRGRGGMPGARGCDCEARIFGHGGSNLEDQIPPLRPQVHKHDRGLPCAGQGQRGAASPPLLPTRRVHMCASPASPACASGSVEQCLAS